jgi:hypothetical protein
LALNLVEIIVLLCPDIKLQLLFYTGALARWLQINQQAQALTFNTKQKTGTRLTSIPVLNFVF